MAEITTNDRQIKEKKSGPIDLGFLITVLVLLGVGLLLMFSASSANALYYHNDSYFYIKNQAKWAAVGIAAMIIAAKFPYKAYAKLAWPIMIVAFGLTVLTLFNRPLNNARRWIIIGSFTFQPSEILKFAVIVLFAKMITDRGQKMRNFKEGLLHFVPILGPIAVILLLQPHFSCTVLIMTIAVAMMLVGGTRIWNFAAVGIPGAAVVLAYIALSQKMSYAMGRIESWLHPFTSTGSGSYQTQQGLIAIGSGGLMGLGLGNSRQKHLYVPEPQNDFIFSIITEEVGLIGAVIVIVLFCIFAIFGFRIAIRARDRFSMLLVFGIVTQIALQAALNIAVVTNSVPNTGISLPFFSQGGTSLVILLAEVGVVLNVSKTCRRD